jgi:NitT/TauT family transport system ATP-binding protein
MARSDQRHRADRSAMLKIQSVMKKFVDQSASGDNNSLIVLDHIDLSVPRNQFVSLLGPSGCGKTTLLRIVAGLVEASAGEIILDGARITGPGMDRSLVFQNYGLLPWRTVMGNVELGLELRGIPKRKRRLTCQDYIDRVGLSGFEGHYPHQISGGMQQRTALARAFSKQPKVLLMDEPFAAVDMQTREVLQEELLTIWNTMKTTVLFVTHSIEEAIYLGDRVVVMSAHPGQIVADILTELPRPRGDIKSTTRFDQLRRAIRDALKHRRGAK